jgi:death on curing protein
VTKRRHAPKWSTRRILDVVHDAQIRDHGGTPGVRDDGLLESALARPRQKWAYGEAPDLATFAAAYAFGLAKNHGYVDGNKRVAFMAAYVFLGLNECDLEADEPDVVSAMERVADGRLGEAALADWFRAGIRPLT